MWGTTTSKGKTKSVSQSLEGRVIVIQAAELYKRSISDLAACTCMQKLMPGFMHSVSLAWPLGPRDGAQMVQVLLSPSYRVDYIGVVPGLSLLSSCGSKVKYVVKKVEQ